jgi:peptidoglycan hydrolase-like protein with peptidoglycan-binding domain
MRFYEFKIVEQQTGVYIIGDSHAKALGGTNNSAENGARLDAIARQADRVPAGATVVVSGGHNDVAAGVSPQQIASKVSQIVSNLEAKGSTVYYILFPTGTQNPNQESMSTTRRAINQAITVNYDLEGKGLASDGQHATMSAYGNIPLPTASEQPTDDETSAGPDDGTRGDEPTDDRAGLEAGPPYPSSDLQPVAEMQSKLEEIGYNVGSTGIDGKYGPRTANAVKAFKEDYELSGDHFEMDAQALATLDKVVSGEIERVSAPTQVAQISGDIGDIAQDSVTQGKVGAVLDLIAGPESAGRYDAVYPGRRRPQILNMTLDQLYDDMRSRGRASGSSASGRYQYIRTTLQSVANSMRLDPATTVFDPETQDRVAIYHLRANHGLDRWLAGRMSHEDFLRRLAGTWAGIPDPSTGESAFIGILDNRAGIRVATAIDRLDQIQRA